MPQEAGEWIGNLGAALATHEREWELKPALELDPYPRRQPGGTDRRPESSRLVRIKRPACTKMTSQKKAGVQFVVSHLASHVCRPADSSMLRWYIDREPKAQHQRKGPTHDDQVHEAHAADGLAAALECEGVADSHPRALDSPSDLSGSCAVEDDRLFDELDGVAKEREANHEHRLRRRRRGHAAGARRYLAHDGV